MPEGGLSISTDFKIRRPIQSKVCGDMFSKILGRQQTLSAKQQIGKLGKQPTEGNHQ
jgi:hypothetical protein